MEMTLGLYGFNQNPVTDRFSFGSKHNVGEEVSGGWRG